MHANRFYSVPFDARCNPKIIKLRNAQGGIIAFGRWQALLGIIFDSDGRISGDAEDRRMLMQELQLDADGLESFLHDCARFGLIDTDIYASTGSVVSDGVCDELEYRRSRSEAGRAGGKASKRTRETDGGT